MHPLLQSKETGGKLACDQCRLKKLLCVWRDEDELEVDDDDLGDVAVPDPPELVLSPQETFLNLETT